TVWQVIGGVGWAVGITLAGYLLGSTVPGIDQYLLPVIAIIVIASAVPVAIELLRARRHRKARPARHARPEPADRTRPPGPPPPPRPHPPGEPPPATRPTLASRAPPARRPRPPRRPHRRLPGQCPVIIGTFRRAGGTPPYLPTRRCRAARTRRSGRWG